MTLLGMLKHSDRLTSTHDQCAGMFILACVLCVACFNYFLEYSRVFINACHLLDRSLVSHVKTLVEQFPCVCELFGLNIVWCECYIILTLYINIMYIQIVFYIILFKHLKIKLNECCSCTEARARAS